MGNFEQFWALEITGLMAIIVLCVLIYTVRQNTLMLKILRDEETSDIPIEERFNGEQAEKWFESGDTKSLNSYCEGYIKNSPNSVNANWFYALSHYSQGDYEVAREYFENVIRINPLWRDGASIYLKEIADKIGFPNQLTVH